MTNVRITQFQRLAEDTAEIEFGDAVALADVHIDGIGEIRGITVRRIDGEGLRVAMPTRYRLYRCDELGTYPYFLPESDLRKQIEQLVFERFDEYDESGYLTPRARKKLEALKHGPQVAA